MSHVVPAALFPLPLALLMVGCAAPADAPRLGVARGAELSEDAAVAERLGQALDGFVQPLRRGEWSAAHSDAAERGRYGFFYKSLLRGAKGAEPLVLKSYPVGDGVYIVTIAFLSGAPDAVGVSRIVELEAVPVAGGYRFGCPYERRTADMQRRDVGSVEYRFRGGLDEARAQEFARAKERVDAAAHLGSTSLRYDRFDSLDDLLRAHGLVYDASKCNFLQHDLGFLWMDGQRFSTGTGDEAYLFGYVRDALVASAKDPAEVYGPWVNGVAAYYGGYGLSGDSVDVLAQQFRGELERRPGIDFLEEFKKGRGASVQRHFSHYVMCALLCREIVAQHGDGAVMGLVESGAEGDRFFQTLERVSGVGEQNFHSTILRLIGAAG